MVVVVVVFCCLSRSLLALSPAPAFPVPADLAFSVFQEEDKRQLRETSAHPPSSERYVHTFRDLSNFSGAINVTYRYLAGTPLNRKSEPSVSLKRKLPLLFFNFFWTGGGSKS